MSATLLIREASARDAPVQRETPSARMPVEAARKALETVLADIMGETLRWHEEPAESRAVAPQNAIRITTGTGKSAQVRDMIAAYVPEAKRRGLPHRVLFLVPTHRLAAEAEARMPEGISTAIWQGRRAEHVRTGEPMCRNLDAVTVAEKLALDVEKHACRRGRRGQEPIKCKFYDRCAYQSQKRVGKEADVVFAAHEIGFRIPEALDDGFGLMVIDESFWQDGITKARLDARGLADELESHPALSGDGTIDREATAHLEQLLRRLVAVLDGHPNGYVTRASLIDAGLLPTGYKAGEPGSGTTARRLEWNRKVDPGLRPDTDTDTRKDALKRHALLGQLPQRAAMWRAIQELLDGDAEASGRLRLVTETTSHGSRKMLHILGRRDLACLAETGTQDAPMQRETSEIPILVADATLPDQLLRQYLPRLDVRLDLDVAAPHENLTQVIGLPVGKSSLRALPEGDRRDGEEARVGRKRQRLRDVVRQLMQGKRRGLVITYNDIEEDFAEIENVETAHFNAIEGLDGWGDVDLLVTIGRPLPRPQAIEELAAAITGKAVTAGEWRDTGAGIQLTDGTTHLLKGRSYESPEAEAVRKAVTEAAIVQAVGRARGVNRTDANPVDVYVVLHDTVVPELEVDAVVDFADLEPDRIDEMLARGIVPQMPADAAKLYPDLFRTRQAAKHAYARAHLNVVKGTKVVPRPYRETSIRRWNHYEVAFRPEGRGQTPRLALVDEKHLDELKARLEAALGPLVHFEVLGPAAEEADPVTDRAAHDAAEEDRTLEVPANQTVRQDIAPPQQLPDCHDREQRRRPRQEPIAPRRQYQPDLFGAEVVDLDYRRGVLPEELRHRVRQEARSRGETQADIAGLVGISRPQLCNVLNGRFGLSPTAAARLLQWIGAP